MLKHNPRGITVPANAARFTKALTLGQLFRNAFLAVSSFMTDIVVGRRKRHVRRVPGFSGKLNYRRTDPRHGMYDPFREKGWKVEKPLPGRHEVLVTPPDGDTLTARAAFREIERPTPRALIFGRGFHTK